MPLPWSPLLVPSSEAWNPNRDSSRSGGVSFLNQEQIVEAPFGYTAARLTIPCKRPAEILAMRAALALGRGQVWIIGPIEGLRAPLFVDPLTGGTITRFIGERDAARDPAWSTNQDTSATLDFRLARAAAMNATTIAVQRVHGGLLSPGMFFSIRNRLHVITALTTADPTDAGGYAAPGELGVQFRPWLRDDYPTGTPIEFERPNALMRLANKDIGALELQLSRFANVSLDFVHAA